MPELPEVYHIAQQMQGELIGKRITAVEVTQEKCLNMPADEFKRFIIDKPIEQIYSRGKWIFTRFHGNTYLMISLGMGGDVIYHPPGDALPPKYQFRFFCMIRALCTCFSHGLGMCMLRMKRA